MAGAKMGRLAFRMEGEHWNAYYATPDTMQDAVWLGSIAMRFVETEHRKQQFMELMQECLADMVQEVVGVRPTFPDEPTPAPEHERSRRA